MPAIIEFHNITKRFGKRAVLDQLDLAIPKGKITFIVGKSDVWKCLSSIGLTIANDSDRSSYPSNWDCNSTSGQ